jgi:uncharacterized protein YgiB involved in biofilm formation
MQGRQEGNVTDFKAKLTITTAVAGALVLAGCNRAKDDWEGSATQFAKHDTQVCTDRSTGQRIEDSHCRKHGSGGAKFFAWYFLSRGAPMPYYGDKVAGGSFARAPGRSYFSAPGSTRMTRASAVSRGGFGSSARSSSFSALG